MLEVVANIVADEVSLAPRVPSRRKRRVKDFSSRFARLWAKVKAAVLCRFFSTARGQWPSATHRASILFL